jgi:integrase
MRWSEIALDLSVWTMPGSRMKNGKPHDVHLSEPARALLRTLSKARKQSIDEADSEEARPKIRSCDFVFSTTYETSVSGFSRAKAALDNAIIQARTKAASAAGTEPAPLIPWRLQYSSNN